jgi:hypothetical protein
MATLYSYCIPIDDGAAPNPYWGVCTLAICKPVIRRNAKIGDWVIGTGSKKHKMENKVVYAMKITDVKTLAQYNRFCKEQLQEKIPDISNENIEKRAGDCIYFQKKGKLNQRKGVHGKGNYDTDTNGKNVLLSDHFYYFGQEPIELPDYLLPIILQGQGHRSRSNINYVEVFIDWLESNTKAKPYYLNRKKIDPYLLKHVFGDNNWKYASGCRKKS